MSETQTVYEKISSMHDKREIAEYLYKYIPILRDKNTDEEKTIRLIEKWLQMPNKEVIERYELAKLEAIHNKNVAT